MRKMKPVCWMVTAALALSLSWTAQPMAADEFVIGGVFAVTGPASFLGDPAKKSLEMAVEAINAQGGIDGRMLKAVVYDSEGDPTKAVMGVSKLINNDGALAIIGPSTTPDTLAVMPKAEQASLPLISCAAGNKITLPPQKWVFKTAQSDILAVAAIYAHVQKQNIKKIAIITVADAFGESGREQLEQQAEKFGLTVVAAEKFGAKDTDMTAQLTKIRSAQAEAIVCWGTNPGPAVMSKNVQQLGITIPLYQSHGVASPKFIELAGDAAEGILLPTGKILVADLLPDTDPQKAVLQAYAKAYQEKYKIPPSGFGGYAYDAMQMLARAAAGAGGDKEKIRASFENLKGHVGVSGTFNFSAEDHNGLDASAFVMVRIKGGKWELVN